MRSIYLIFASLLLSHFSASSQVYKDTLCLFDTSRDSTYYSTYNKLKELYIKQMLSPDYQTARQMTIVYRRKLRSKGNFDTSLIAKDPGGLKWLETNWQKTEFTSYDEAKDEFDAIVKLMGSKSKENQEFNDYHYTAVLKYGPQIFIDMYMEVRLEYPDKI
jgi:hypothetical protein